MKCLTLTTITLLALAGCAGPAATRGDVTFNADGSATATINAARVADCKANGGCGLYSRAELAELVEAAAAAGQQASCRRESSI